MIGYIDTLMVQTINGVTANDRESSYTKEYLNVMPGIAYVLKPTPDIRSFAERMLHLTALNYVLIAAATGERSGYELGKLAKTTADKSNLNDVAHTLTGLGTYHRYNMKPSVFIKPVHN